MNSREAGHFPSRFKITLHNLARGVREEKCSLPRANHEPKSPKSDLALLQRREENFHDLFGGKEFVPLSLSNSGVGGEEKSRLPWAHSLNLERSYARRRELGTKRKLSSSVSCEKGDSCVVRIAASLRRGHHPFSGLCVARWMDLSGPVVRMSKDFHSAGVELTFLLVAAKVKLARWHRTESFSLSFDQLRKNCVRTKVQRRWRRRRRRRERVTEQCVRENAKGKYCVLLPLRSGERKGL